MIVKGKSVPYNLIGLKALQRRISENHPQATKINERIRIATAGVNGEKSLHSIFVKYKFNYKHFVLHDLNLTSTGKFQIDTLFLSSQGAFILEVKNIAGRISFPEQWNQLVRVLDNGQIDSFECPSIQLERNSYLLKDWFEARNLSIPVSGAVVFTKTSQHIENSRAHLTILFPNEVPSYLRKRESNATLVDFETIAHATDELLNSHADYNPYPMCETFHIKSNEIKSGVQCEKCGTLGMMKVNRGWGCKVCQNVSKTAHRQAIADWFMLKRETMTNLECREFLHIKNNYTATRLMRDFPLQQNGANRGSYYSFPLEMMSSLYEESPDLQAKER